MKEQARPHTGHVLTITVDRAMCAGLHAIALNFLPAAFVTGPGYTTALLGRSR